jgi:HSP20 family molecular chaperone IbpA
MPWWSNHFPAPPRRSMEDPRDRQSTDEQPHPRSLPEDLMDQWFESILRQNQDAMMRGPGYHRHQNPGNDNNFSSFSTSSSSYSSSYQMQENDQQVQISVNVPNMSKQDIDVQVISQTGPYSSCMVQLLSNNNNNNNNSEKPPVVTSTTGHRTLLGQRFRLGQNVDCDHLAASLSRGVLHLTAPKFQPEPVSEPVTRSIPINLERDDE